MTRQAKDSVISWLRADLKRFDHCQSCAMCGAALYDFDEYAADPDGEPSCWPSVGAKEGKGKPCYKYRGAPADLPAPPRESVPHVMPYQRTTTLARGPAKSGVDRYMTPAIEERLKRLNGKGGTNG